MKPELKMRNWIWKALCEIVLHDAYSNLYLKTNLQQLSSKDQALATRIVYGTLQNYSYCQSVWKQYASRKVPARIGVLLTFSVYQLLFLDNVPKYAIIHQAVELAKTKSRSLGGFVNAILNKIDPEKIEVPEAPLQKAAFESSLPLWLVEKWAGEYGEEKAIEYARASVSTHPVYKRNNPIKSGKAGIELYSGSVGSDPDYQKGLFSIQDPGSYEIVEFLDPKPEEIILDLCAAPGTKSFAMAERMENKGRIDAMDLYESRVELIEKDKARLGLDIVKPRVGDGTKIEDLELYDRILCDVPCSGYGVLSRKPDMKLKLNPQEEKELIQIQKELLESASSHLKNGGLLVYSTCTLNKNENENQVEAFLQAHPEFELTGMKTVDLNDLHDGFFMAGLRRKHEEHL